MDFITAGDYKNYLARMFQFDWTKVCLVMIASAIFFLLIYTITQWKYLSFRGIGVCMLLGVYMGCVAGVTLYNRTPSGVHRVNLEIYTITQWKYLSFRGIGVCMLLGVYMGCVAGVTLYNRTPSGVHRVNLELFWSYREYFETGSKIRIVENVCNIVMLVPFGILVPLLLFSGLTVNILRLEVRLGL